MVFDSSRGFSRGGIVVHGGLKKRFIYHFYGKASNCWETFNIVIIRDWTFSGGRLGSCLRH